MIINAAVLRQSGLQRPYSTSEPLIIEKIELKKICDAKMINLIGNDINLYKGKKFNDNEFFYDYLKKEVKEKRKMGHITILKN